MPIEWSPSISIGHDDIDADHMRLIRILNEFEASPDLKSAENSARKLLAYTQDHFQREEVIQEKIGYPDRKNHKAQHDAIIADLKGCIRQFFLDKHDTPTEQVVWTMWSLMNDWVIGHVKMVDTAMRPLFKSRTTQALPSDALKVLVVDDQSLTRNSIAKFLTVKLKMAVDTATDGQDAIDKFCAGSPPDLVLCDISMPHLDGLGFLQWLRGPDSPHPDVPLIFLTGNKDQMSVDAARQGGCAGYLLKPVSMDRLIAEVQRVLDIAPPQD